MKGNYRGARLRLFLVVALWMLASPVTAVAPENPNFIVIIADDMGWGDIGYHNAEVKTPHLDRLARNGFILDRFYTKMACTPARAAYLTGRHPFRFGMASSVIKPWDKKHVPFDQPLLSVALQEAGYQTALIGKWHLGHYENTFLPKNRGFDYHYGSYCGDLDYNTHEVVEFKFGGLDWHRNGQVVREVGYVTSLLGQDAENFLRYQLDERPFYMQLAFTAPHLPLQLPGQSWDGKNYPLGEEARQIYLEQLSIMDRQIGGVIEALQAAGRFDETLIWFFSDNGAEVYLGDLGGGKNRPLRGGKGSLYEGGLRVPAFVHIPWLVDQRRSVADNVSVVDIYPTLLDFAGEAKPAESDGLSLVGLFEAEQALGRDLLLLQAPYGDEQVFAVIYQDFKLIINGGYLLSPSSREGEFELYDIRKDPMELNNVFHQHPEVVERIFTAYQAYLNTGDKVVVKATKSKRPKGWAPPEVWTPEALSATNPRWKMQLRRLWHKKTIFGFVLGVALSALIVLIVLRGRRRLSV